MHGTGPIDGSLCFDCSKGIGARAPQFVIMGSFVAHKLFSGFLCFSCALGMRPADVADVPLLSGLAGDLKQVGLSFVARSPTGALCRMRSVILRAFRMSRTLRSNKPSSTAPGQCCGTGAFRRPTCLALASTALLVQRVFCRLRRVSFSLSDLVVIAGWLGMGDGKTCAVNTQPVRCHADPPTYFIGAKGLRRCFPNVW